MTATDSVWIVTGILAWLALIGVRLVRARLTSLSSAELVRRAENGDQVASYEVWRAKLLSRVEGLKRLVESLLFAIVALILFHLFGLILGGFTTVGTLLAAAFIESRGSGKLVNRLYARHEPGLLKRVEGLAWLGWFAPVEKARSMRVGSREELAELIEHISPQVLSRDDRAMLLAELEFADTRVADVMTPKSMVDTVTLDETIGPLLLDRLYHTGHSRFPVIDGDIDHVVGMLYLHELVSAKGAPETVKKALHSDVYYIGENRDLEHALHAFLHSRHHLFIVVNEYRETVGILSLEDVIETLIGRSIVDEFDAFDDLRSVAATNPKSNNAPKGHKDI